MNQNEHEEISAPQDTLENSYDAVEIAAEGPSDLLLTRGLDALRNQDSTPPGRDDAEMRLYIESVVEGMDGPH